MNDSSTSFLTTPHSSSKDSQDFSHLFSKQCQTTLSNMEILDRKVRTRESNHTPRVMARIRENQNPRRDLIGIITLSRLILMLKPRTTVILNTLRSTLEKEKAVRIGTIPPITIGTREMKGIIANSLGQLQGGPTRAQMIGNLLLLLDNLHTKAKDRMAITPGPGEGAGL